MEVVRDDRFSGLRLFYFDGDRCIDFIPSHSIKRG